MEHLVFSRNDIFSGIEEGKMQVYGYVFLDESEENLMSLYEQQQSIQKFGAENGLRITNFFVEEKTTLKRPLKERKEGNILLSTLNRNDVIIVMKAEWILGSAKEGLWLVETLNNLGVPLFCVDLNENISMPAPRKLQVTEGGATLIRQILSALAVCESSKHGDSIRAAKQKLKSEGKYAGGPVPFGYEVKNKRLVTNKGQQKIIREILKLRDNRWSYRNIAMIVKEKHDVSLSHEGVRKIVLSKKTTGGTPSFQKL